MMARTRIARRLVDVGVETTRHGALARRRRWPSPDLLLDDLLDQAPIAVERRDQLAIGLHRPVEGFDHDAPFAFFLTSIGVVLQRGEEIPPLRDRPIADRPQ